MKDEGNIKRGFKRFWHLLWKDDSIKGWIFSLIVFFIFVKFIFFPGMSLLTGSKVPLIIVESCSMYHKGNIFSSFDNWWSTHKDKYGDFDISEGEFKAFQLKKGFDKGDIFLVIKPNPEKLKIGDIIIFEAGQQHPIIHRIIKIEKIEDELIFSTLGDNNNGQLSFEKEITEDKILGKVAFRIVPYLGWGKLVFIDWKKPEGERGFCSEN